MKYLFILPLLLLIAVLIVTITASLATSLIFWE